MIGFDDKGHNPSSVMEEYSPSIPKDFPKNKMPENLCEEELLKMFRCTKYISEREAC